MDQNEFEFNLISYISFSKLYAISLNIISQNMKLFCLKIDLSNFN